MSLLEFEQNFAGHDIPEELVSLYHFQTEHSEYSQGFYLHPDDKSGLKTWSDNEEFLVRLMPFAQANYSGSFYAVWNDGSGRSPSEFPIIVFGDEGGEHIVAGNILQLMQLLTFDAELLVDSEGISFYKDGNGDEKSEDADIYMKWLKENFDKNPIDYNEAKEIIENACQKYQSAYDDWSSKYF